jgi:hypothetical protein
MFSWSPFISSLLVSALASSLSTKATIYPQSNDDQ